MLKIGTIRWKGKCAKHAMYDPQSGEGAIVGGCRRCHQLLEIHGAHKRTMELMKEFGPQRESKSQPEPKVEDDRQLRLF